MPPVKYVEGTKSPGTPSEYTDLQWAALDALLYRDRPLMYNAARPDLVNKVLLPNGTLSDDLATVRAAIVRVDEEDVVRFDAFTAEHRDAILRGTLAPELRPQLQDLQYWANHSQTKEFDDHVAQQRFLLVVDADNVVRIWFQCAVYYNPDVHLPDGRSLAEVSGASFPTMEA